jgi:hypothetical protein
MSTDFELAVANFIKKAKKNPELVVRQVTIKLYSQIIMASPVDTGRFRMNWQVSNNKPATGVLIADDPSGSRAIGRMTAYVTTSEEWENFCFTNNMPYADRLEYGWSRQAPQGMVRITVSRFQRLLNEAAAKAD